MEDRLINSKIYGINYYPKNWKLGRFKNLCKIFSGGTPDTNNILYWDGNIPWIQSGKLQYNDIYDESRFITELGLNHSSTKMIRKDTPLLAMTGATCGNVGFLRINACANQSVMAFETNNYSDSRFIYYSLINSKVQILLLQSGGAQSGISTQNGMNLKLVFPEFKEQKKIAEYLDKKCSKIDEIIKDNNKEIVLLNEYKKSLINDKIHSFNSEMIKLKYLVNVRNEKGTSTNSEQFISLENIESGTGKYIHTKTDYTNCDGKIFKKGDLLINKLRPYLAKTYLAEFDGVCTGEIEVVSQFKGNINFLKYFTLSPKYIDNVNSSTYGTKMPRASWDFIKNLEINLPSRNIQNQVVEYLDKQCSKLDEVIEYRKQIIEKLEEYKKSLIYECVTGKREV